MGRSKEVGAPALTGAQHARNRLTSVEPAAGAVERRRQIEIGGGGVSHLELHGLANAKSAIDRDGAARLIEPSHRPHQKVAALVIRLVFIRRHAEQQIATRLRPNGAFERVEGLHQHVNGRAIANRFDPAVRHPRDRPGLADRFAPLRDKRDKVVLPADRQTDRTAADHVVVDEEPRFPVARAGRRQAADYRRTRIGVIELREERGAVQLKGVAEQEPAAAVIARHAERFVPTFDIPAGRNVIGREPDGGERRAGQRHSQEGKRGQALKLAIVGDHGRCRAADQRPRTGLGSHPREDFREMAAPLVRAETEHNVRLDRRKFGQNGVEPGFPISAGGERRVRRGPESAHPRPIHWPNNLPGADRGLRVPAPARTYQTGEAGSGGFCGKRSRSGEATHKGRPQGRPLCE